jgi:Tfp pilus assembly protein PilV
MKVITGHQRQKPTRAFSLLEVMIAMAIFFVAIFAILNLTSQSLASARRLQLAHVDATSLAASLSLTNRLEEGPLPSDIVAQFEEQHPGFTCNGNIFEASSNGLFQVDLEIRGLKEKKVVGSTMSILLYRSGASSAFRSRLSR